MIKRIELTFEDLRRNAEACAKEVESWPAWKRNLFGGFYRKKIVAGKVVLYQEKPSSYPLFRAGQKMKRYPIYRPHSWLDISTKTEKFGIQGKVSADSKWLHVAEDGEPCIYDTAQERDAHMEAMKTRYWIGSDPADEALVDYTVQVEYARVMSSVIPIVTEPRLK